MLRSARGSAIAGRCGAAFVLACLASAFTLTGALAHAVVVRSEPADGAVVSQAPPEIRIWFSEPLTPEFSKAEVLDARSQPEPGVQFHTDPADPTLMIVTLPALPDGLYNIVYTSLSAADGHATQGHLVFTAAAAGTDGAAAPFRLTACRSAARGHPALAQLRLVGRGDRRSGGRRASAQVHRAVRCRRATHRRRPRPGPVAGVGLGRMVGDWRR